MVLLKNKISPKCKITLDDEELQQVESVSYLGSVLTQDCRCTSDNKTRIALAKHPFTDMSSIFTNKQLENDTKKRLMKCYIWLVLMYGCESWTLSKRDESRLEAMELWIYCRMKKISWLDKKKNKEGLEMMEEERSVINYSSETTEIRWAHH